MVVYVYVRCAHAWHIRLVYRLYMAPLHTCHAFDETIWLMLCKLCTDCASLHRKGVTKENAISQGLKQSVSGMYMCTCSCRDLEPCSKGVLQVETLAKLARLATAQLWWHWSCQRLRTSATHCRRPKAEPTVPSSRPPRRVQRLHAKPKHTNDITVHSSFA